MRLLLVVLAFLPAAFAQEAAPPTIQMRTEVSPKTITIGDPVLYRIVIDIPPAVRPEPPQLPAKTGEFELLDLQSDPPAPREGGGFRLEHRLTFTTFSTGTHVFPALSLPFQSEGNKTIQAQTPTVEIKVESLLEKFGDEGNLRPLKGFFNFRSYTWLWILLGLLLAAVAAMGLVRRIRKKNGGSAAAPGPPPRPPEEVVWEMIHDLEASTYLADGNVKEYYSRISNAVRFYLEGRYGFSALDRTTTELLGELRRRNFPPEQTSILRTIFTNADLVKFAKFLPAEAEAVDDLTRLKKFVHETTPQKEAAVR